MTIICPKCHYDWRIPVSRCKCGTYLDHACVSDGIGTANPSSPAWIQEHKKFIDKLPFKEHLKYYENSGDEKKQIAASKKWSKDADEYIQSLKNVSENGYKSFKNNKFLIARVVQEAIPEAKIYISYGDVKNYDGRLLVINETGNHGEGKIVIKGKDEYDILMQIIKGWQT